MVKLYFQVTPDLTFTSPGVPLRGSKQNPALDGLTTEQISANTRLLSQLSRSVEPNTLLAQCAPPKPLTVESIAALAAPPSQSLAPPPNPDALPQDSPFSPMPEPQIAANPAPQLAQSDKQRALNVQEYSTRKNRYQTQSDNLNAQTQLRDQFNYGNISAEEPFSKMPNATSVPRFAAPPAIVEGLTRPMWMGQELLLARRVNVGEQSVIQGCWFDWNAVKAALQAEVADLLGPIDVVPVSDDNLADPTRLLATLSAQLVATIPPLPASAAKLTPVRLALLAAWVALAVAALAAALLLRGVMALSERRAAFVSAVTHELRTPLTTFRMYSEMLAEGMVPDESQRRHYLGTLKTEADRLFHLIENVLSYARLERGRPTVVRNTTTVGELLAPMVRRLTERAERDNMHLVLELNPGDANTAITTDAGALEQILVNLVDNACKYAATATDRRIEMAVRSDRGCLILLISDRGPGISAAEARKLFRPFTKSASQAAQTAPGVGLGLALSQRLARDLGGELELSLPAANLTGQTGAVFTLTLPLKM